MKKNKITVIWGEATIDAPGKVAVKASKSAAPKGALGPGAYQAKHVIIATGARPRVLPGLEPDKKLIWTYFEAMAPDRMPKSLLVIGSGAIGVEFASFYRTFGAEVTVVEVLPQILPVEDAEIAAFARKAFEKQGIKILTGAKVTKLDKKPDSVTATIDDGKGGTPIAHGRARHLRGRRHRQYRESRAREARREDRARHHRRSISSTAPTCPASTRSATSPARRMLAHKAEHEGVICVEAIKGLKPHPMDKRLIPGCTYCSPQIASVGLTEQAAKEKKLEIRVGRFPFVGNGKAIALGEDQGLVKVIFDKKTGQLLGAHMIGRRGHRADPGLRGGDEPGDHRGGAHAHGLPASDPLRDDEGSGARRLWSGTEHLKPDRRPRRSPPFAVANRAIAHRDRLHACRMPQAPPFRRCRAAAAGRRPAHIHPAFTLSRAVSAPGNCSSSPGRSLSPPLPRGSVHSAFQMSSHDQYSASDNCAQRRRAGSRDADAASCGRASGRESNQRSGDFSFGKMAALFVLLLAITSIPVVLHPWPPMSDYINHLARMHVIATIKPRSRSRPLLRDRLAGHSQPDDGFDRPAAGARDERLSGRADLHHR